MYEVQAGDTPARIAQAFTGDASRGAELVAANPYKPRAVYGGGQLGAVGQVSFRELSQGERIHIPRSWPAGLAGPNLNWNVASYGEVQNAIPQLWQWAQATAQLASVSNQPTNSSLTMWYSGGWYYSACVFGPPNQITFYKSSSSPNYGTNGVQAPSCGGPGISPFPQGLNQLPLFVQPPLSLFPPFIAPPASLFRPPTANQGGNHLSPTSPSFPRGPGGPIQGLPIGALGDASSIASELASFQAATNISISPDADGSYSSVVTSSQAMGNIGATVLGPDIDSTYGIGVTGPITQTAFNLNTTLAAINNGAADTPNAATLLDATNANSILKQMLSTYQTAARNGSSAQTNLLPSAPTIPNTDAPSPAPSTPPRTVPVSPQPSAPITPPSSQPIQPVNPAPAVASSSSTSSIWPWIIGGLAVVVVGGLIYASSRHKTVLTKTSSHAPRKLRRLKHARSRRPSHRRLRHAGRRRR